MVTSTHRPTTPPTDGRTPTLRPADHWTSVTPTSDDPSTDGAGDEVADRVAEEASAATATGAGPRPAGHRHEDGPLVPFWLARAAAYGWRGLVVAAALYASVWLLARLSVVVIPVIVALILTTLCLPPAQWLERRGLPEAVAAGIVVIGGLVAIIGGLAALTPTFVDQIADLEPAVRDGIDFLLETAADFGYDRDRLDELLSQAGEALTGSASSVIGGIAGGASAVASGLAGIALLVVLLFFFVKDADEIRDWITARTPSHRRELVARLGERAWSALSGYVRGTAAIAAIDAVAIGIGLAIIGVPLVLPLSLLVFLGAFLPVIGAFVAGLVAVLVALASGGLTTAVWTLVLIIGVQQVEGNVLHPTIMRRAVALHPVVVLTALAVGATLAGIVGAFLSLPVAAVLAAVGNELRLRADARREPGEPTGAGADPAPAT